MMIEVITLLIVNNLVICGAVIGVVCGMEKLTQGQLDTMAYEIRELKRDLKNVKKGVISDD